VNLGLESGIGLDNINADARVVGENFKGLRGGGGQRCNKL